MKKKRFMLTGLHCVSCSMLIEGELEDIGVAARCNYAKQYVDAEWDERKTNEEAIRKTIEKLGYGVL